MAMLLDTWNNANIEYPIVKATMFNSSIVLFVNINLMGTNAFS